MEMKAAFLKLLRLTVDCTCDQHCENSEITRQRPADTRCDLIGSRHRLLGEKLIQITHERIVSYGGVNVGTG